MLKQWECHSDNTFTILHYEVAAERVAYTHTHISEVVMCVSDTNYTVSMLANKCRRTTFATSFITIFYLLDLCYNLSDLTLMFMLINDQIKGDWL